MKKPDTHLSNTQLYVWVGMGTCEACFYILKTNNYSALHMFKWSFTLEILHQWKLLCCFDWLFDVYTNATIVVETL
jgi:hypothetical protein